MNKTILIGLEIPDELKKEINDIRNLIKNNDINSSYPTHEHHITLFLNSFDNKDIKIVEQKLKEIKSFNQFKINLKGVTSFREKGSPDIFVFKTNKSKKLLDLRTILIEELMPLTNKENYNWIISQNKLSKSEKKELLETGSTITPKKYQFHTTLGIFSREVQPLLKKHKKEISFIIKHITLFNLDKNNIFKPTKRFSLKTSKK